MYGTITLGKRLVITITKCPTSFSPRHIPQRVENMCSNRNEYRNVHSNMIHNRQRGETPKCLSVGEWTKYNPSIQQSTAQQQKVQTTDT